MPSLQRASLFPKERSLDTSTRKMTCQKVCQKKPQFSDFPSYFFQIIQILCFLVISSLGVILVSVPNSSQLSPAISSILMTGYPFFGALCFAITGTVSIISGKKSNKPFAINSLIFSAVSSVAAGVGLILLAGSLVALRTASQQCDSGRDYLSSMPYSTYYYSIYDVKDCLLTSVDLTGVLLVMLNFTVLELLAAAYASVFWWRRSTVTALRSSSHE
ncbi:membrane-spanning 4-domains subfamily A member 7-like isoform X3 [Bos indicus x Bos taurus]|uniref:membrane-spanning 4-domains subfamily A member 7-like isoform X3 n=1 Tax=Bos indicus x Bos taurus TaxID=30522 RepID=UPI000F7D0A56|nr:membrane-spanning 4-domains subfamily A member 7-like isoform X3 [Bos indicus x Bos taurus]